MTATSPEATTVTQEAMAVTATSRGSAAAADWANPAAIPSAPCAAELMPDPMPWRAEAVCSIERVKSRPKLRPMSATPDPRVARPDLTRSKPPLARWTLIPSCQRRPVNRRIWASAGPVSASTSARMRTVRSRVSAAIRAAASPVSATTLTRVVRSWVSSRSRAETPVVSRSSLTLSLVYFSSISRYCFRRWRKPSVSGRTRTCTRPASLPPGPAIGSPPCKR